MSRYHPDKNKEEGAEEKFVDIAYGKQAVTRTLRFKLTLFIAYEVLSDSTVRVGG